jgi:hypothetical protein
MIHCKRGRPKRPANRTCCGISSTVQEVALDHRLDLSWRLAAEQFRSAFAFLEILADRRGIVAQMLRIRWENLRCRIRSGLTSSWGIVS